MGILVIALSINRRPLSALELTLSGLIMGSRVDTTGDNKSPNVIISNYHASLVVRKPAFCICENKDAYQLHSNCAADQRLCFHCTYSTSTIPRYYLNPKFQASSHLLWLYRPVCVGPSRKPRRPVFSQRGSCIYYKIHSFYICIFSSPVELIVYRSSRRLCVRACVHTFKHEYLCNQLADWN